MKQGTVAFLCAAFSLSPAAQHGGGEVATVPGVGTIRYGGAAVGFHVALDVIEPAGVAFDVGAVGDVKFSLNRYGALCYKPSAGFWIGGDDDSYERRVDGVWRIVERKWVYTEIYVNMTDVAYYFPVPARTIVRPYAGWGVALTIDRWVYEDELGADNDDTDVNAGFNMMAGADFRFAERIGAFAEIRGKLSHHWNVVKFAAGVKFAVGR